MNRVSSRETVITGFLDALEKALEDSFISLTDSGKWVRIIFFNLIGPILVPTDSLVRSTLLHIDSLE